MFLSPISPTSFFLLLTPNPHTISDPDPKPTAPCFLPRPYSFSSLLPPSPFPPPINPSSPLPPHHDILPHGPLCACLLRAYTRREFGYSHPFKYDLYCNEGCPDRGHVRPKRPVITGGWGGGRGGEGGCGCYNGAARERSLEGAESGDEGALVVVVDHMSSYAGRRVSGIETVLPIKGREVCQDNGADVSRGRKMSERF